MDPSWRRRSTALLVVLVLVGTLGVAGAPGAGAAAPMAEVDALYAFGLATSAGSGTVSNLVADGRGVLYGTTNEGGQYGYGTVFAMTPPGPGEEAWTHTVLHSFCQQSSCADGSYPSGGLVFAEQPNHVTALFGMTNEGGDGGYGTIFRLEPPVGPDDGWTHTVLATFGGGANGAYPLGSLVAAPTGPLALYGTTYEGGSGDCSPGCGTVFELTAPNADHPDWWEHAVLHSFDGGSDGAYPQAGVTFGNGHALYGTTWEGGSAGVGTIFTLTPPAAGETQWSEAVLHTFLGDADGSYPVAGLLVDPKGGGLYGTTSDGGSFCTGGGDVCGTAFKLTPPDKLIPEWTLVTLHAFGEGHDAAHPLGELIFGADGAIYGTSEYGGTPVGDATGPCDFLFSCGTVFRMTGAGAEWDLAVIYEFCSPDTGCPVGAHPTAGLTLAGGRLYGTTSYNGDGAACGCGTVIALTYPAVAELPPDEPDRDAPIDPVAAPLAPVLAPLAPVPAPLTPAAASLAVVATPTFTG